jgi:ABC-2 type transport system ATP-binding protein
MIEVDNLTKRYGPYTAVDGVSFRVNRGEILGFLGPNGAGKTTTMRILTCFMPASSGTARVAGYDVFEDPMEVKRRVGYLPETPPLYPDLRVVDQLQFVAKVKGMPKGDRAARIDEVIEKTRIGDVRQRLIGRLSKGYRQRVGLAQALLNNPDVLILDEPTAGLDPKQIIETRELIRGLGGEHTIVLSTHILPEVSMTCGRVLIINKGRVVAEDTPDNLTHRLQGSEGLRVEVRGEAGAVELALRGVAGVASVKLKATSPDGVTFEVDAQAGRDIRAELARSVIQKGFDLVGLQRVGMSLEEIFLHLTTADTADSARSERAVADEPVKEVTA